jgi:hypothetical protein
MAARIRQTHQLWPDAGKSQGTLCWYNLRRDNATVQPGTQHDACQLLKLHVKFMMYNISKSRHRWLHCPSVACSCCTLTSYSTKPAHAQHKAQQRQQQAAAAATGNTQKVNWLQLQLHLVQVNACRSACNDGSSNTG